MGMKNQETDVNMICEAGDVRVAKRSVMKKQRIAAFALALSIVLLGVAIAVANHFVGIYYIHDEYIDENNQKQTERYTVRRENGTYKMFNREGKLMERVAEHSYESTSEGAWYNVYTAETSGNQYMINSVTGEYELYALVDYDASIGETLGGTAVSKRVMIFPHVSQENTYAIRVSNQYGSYELYRQNVLETDSSTGKKYTTIVNIRGTEGTDTTYDSMLFASLCVSCGYPLSTMKLDFSDPATPRDENGNVRYEDYGLKNIYDENGNLTYAPAVYTIVKGEYDSDGYCSPATRTVTVNGEQVERAVEYTVRVGYPILSGGGYYVQLEGRDTVYIVSSAIEDTVLQPIEALVMPLAVYPMSVNTYMMVNDFYLGTLESYVDDGSDPSADDLKLIAAFSFVDTSKRDGSILTLVPYDNQLKFLDGYRLDSDRVNHVLERLYRMEFVGCKKLNPTDEDLVTYGLDKNVFYMTFKYDPKITTGGSNAEDHVKNALLISQRTEQGTHYVYSELYNMIVEVDEYYFSFLNWEQRDWYNPSFFQHDVSYMKEMSFKIGGVTYDFLLDNALSYAYYDKGDGTGERIDLSKGVLSESGETYTVTKTGKSYQVYRMDLKNGKTYRDKASDKCYYIGSGDRGNILVEIAASNINLQVYQKTAQGNKLIDYTITREEDMGASGQMQTKIYTAADNFRRLYTMLLQYSLEGDADLSEFTPDVKTYITQNDAVAEIRYSLEDLASMLNPDVFEENHKREAIIRFYEYPGSERHLFLTIETLAEGAEPDPANGQGRFYVLSTQLSDLSAGLEAFLAGELLADPA